MPSPLYGFLLLPLLATYVSKIRRLSRDFARSLIHEFYKITTGQTEHPLYKENDQIELRKNIEEEFGISCLNYSDSKIGDEIIKKFYCQEKKINYEELPKKGFFRKTVDARNCIAKYVKFTTPELQQFLETLKKKSFRMG